MTWISSGKRPPRKEHNPVRPPTGRRAARLSGATLLWLALALAIPLPVAAQDAGSPAPGADALPADVPLVSEEPAGGEAGSVDWLEPRGLGIFDMVGQAPDEHLRGSVIVNLPGNGLLLYQSGKRSGDTVEVNVNVVPSYFTHGSSVFTRVSCLGQVATYDTWPVASPASRMEIFSNGAPVHQTTRQVFYYPAGHRQPVNGAGAFERYARIQVEPSFASDGSLSLPPNMGCSIVVEGKRTNVTARIRLTLPQRVQVVALGSETFAAQSYIGPGSAGILSSLSRQMSGRYGNRAPAFDIHPPSGTDYVYFNFPPTPADPYSGEPINYGLPGGGTYRFERRGGGLSVDRISSMGIPLHGQWQDADQAGGSYLPHFSNPPRMAAPEYFLPPGVPYEPCMTNGGCSGALLDRIYNATYNVTVYYYQVSRVTGNGLSRVALRQVGKGWSTAAAAEAADAIGLNGENATLPDGTPVEAFIAVATVKRYLPLVTAQRVVPETAEDRSGCPCGWFDPDGAMVDFIPPP
jgi:hypothetical protein